MAYTETALYVDSVQYINAAAWAATHAYSVGNIARQSAPTANNERCFVCVVAGTSLASEPGWVLTKGAATVEASGPTWRECTGIPGLNADAANTPAWGASKGSIVVGVVIKNVAATHYFMCTTAGTGGTGAEPSWNTTAGATTTDGSVTWTCLGAISNFTTKWGASHARLWNATQSATWLVNAGMNVFVGDDHAESQSGINIVFAQHCQVLCVDHTVALPATSANLKTTASLTDTSGSAGINYPSSGAFSVYTYGLNFISNAWCVCVGTPIGQKNILESCRFFSSAVSGGQGSIIGSFGGNVPAIIEFKNCTFQWGTAAAGFLSLQKGNYWLKNCTFTGPASSAPDFWQNNNNTSCQMLVEGCDLSFINVPWSWNQIGYWCFKDCKLPTPVIASTGMNDSTLYDFSRCDNSLTANRNERHTFFADETTSVLVARTGGAIDGATPVSHQVATTININNSARIFNAIPLVIWNAITGGSRGVTLYGITTDTRLPNNDEVWFEVEYLGDTASPKGSFISSGKANILAATSPLTADNSAWDSQVPARINSQLYVVGLPIKVASNPGRLFVCTTGGTTASSEPGGYASAVDGGSVTDGTAVFRAAIRFSQTISLNAPYVNQPGYLYVYPKFGRPNMTYYLDPLIGLV